MKKNKVLILFFTLLILGILAGCSKLPTQNNTNANTGAVDVKLYDEFTDIKLFQGVPVMSVENGRTDIKGDIGGGNQVILVNGSVEDEYWNYLTTLQENGFEKYVDNGEEGLYGDVLSATLTKENLVISVIHMKKTELTYIIAEDELPLSDRLIYKDEYVKDNVEGAKTTLHMLELSDYGNSFVIQLKNGHFIITDGGRDQDLPYLLDYLESLVPKGEKPVVEAWLITHAHGDHASVLEPFDTNWMYTDRIFVEGFYMDSYNSDVTTRMGVTGIQLAVRTAANKLQTTDGGHPKIYRPQAGQTYYFSDITVDVMQTMLQCPEENWYRWNQNVNEFSAWFMFNIEGQKYLNIGDADFGSMRTVMRTYDSEDLDMDIMAVSHHGINVHDEFSDFISVKTLLYPNFGIYGSFEEGQSWGGSWQASVTRNEYLQKNVLESYSFIDGTQVLTFPYKVGTAESLGHMREDRVPINDEHRIKYY